MLPALNEGLSDITLSLADCGYSGFIAPKTLNYWLSDLSILSVPDEGYSRNASCALNLI